MIICLIKLFFFLFFEYHASLQYHQAINNFNGYIKSWITNLSFMSYIFYRTNLPTGVNINDKSEIDNILIAGFKYLASNNCFCRGAH